MSARATVPILLAALAALGCARQELVDQPTMNLAPAGSLQTVTIEFTILSLPRPVKPEELASAVLLFSDPAAEDHVSELYQLGIAHDNRLGDPDRAAENEAPGLGFQIRPDAEADGRIRAFMKLHWRPAKGVAIGFTGTVVCGPEKYILLGSSTRTWEGKGFGTRPRNKGVMSRLLFARFGKIQHTGADLGG